MYSAVLMLALTAGNDAVDFGRKSCHSCTSTYGCTTYSAPVMAPSCSTSCHRSSCHGGLFTKMFHRHHCCTTTTTCTVYSSGCCTTTMTPMVPAKPKDMPKEMKGEPVPPPKKTSLNAPATMIVSLPADARLFVDGAPTTSTSDRRSLVTPALEFGSTYVYTVRAEVVRDGRTVEQTQQVTVRGGEVSPVRFDFSTQTVASR
jgi:uncharacterized protein (TIGR03000 family)